jgi:acetylornithine/succinyldiaminopimelate/putrescine aminotransferase
VRGRGLLLALILTEQGIAHGQEIVQQMFQRGLLINFAGMRVLRFLPPLTVNKEEIDLLIAGLKEVFQDI